MKWNVLLCACIVVATVLLFAGAPLLPVVLGVALAALWLWFRRPKPGRSAARTSN